MLQSHLVLKGWWEAELKSSSLVPEDGIEQKEARRSPQIECA